MGIFIRAVHIFKETVNITNFEQLVYDFYAQLGVRVQTFEYSTCQGQLRDREFQGIDLAFMYNSTEDWFSFYPDHKLTDKNITQIVNSKGGNGIYLFVSDSDDWGFYLFERGQLSFQWERSIGEPLDISDNEISEVQEFFSRLFGKQISYEEIQNLLITDVEFSEEKIVKIGEYLDIPGARVGRMDILDGYLPNINLSNFSVIQLEYPRVQQKREQDTLSAEQPTIQQNIIAEACDVCFFARWTRNKNSQAHLGAYVIDAITLFRDLLVGAEWLGRTFVALSPGVEDRLDSTRRRLEIAKTTGMIRENEQPTFSDESWQDIIQAEPFTEEDLFLISQHIDRNEVVVLFADLDDAGSYAYFTAQGSQNLLLMSIPELFYMDQTINDAEIYYRFFGEELDSMILNPLFVKSKSEYGCISVAKETNYSYENILEYLNVWPPKGNFINYLGSGIVKPVEQKLQERIDLVKDYEVSRQSSGALVIKIPFQPYEIAKTEFQESLSTLSDIFADVLR
jgi:hypothetical protein